MTQLEKSKWVVINKFSINSIFMKKLFDLRFVIGLFFSVTGMLLSIYHLFSEELTNINFWCGLIFLVFGISMILLSYFGKASE